MPLESFRFLRLVSEEVFSLTSLVFNLLQKCDTFFHGEGGKCLEFL